MTNKLKTISATYHIHNIQLKQAKRAKYLGLTVSNTLSWNAHIDTTTKMTNSTLVNVYVDLVVFTRNAGTSYTGSGRYWC